MEAIMATVTNDLDYAANEAVFGLQLSFNQAVRFVCRNAKVDNKTAKHALEAVMTGYKESNITGE
jgi:hypothetical protein